MQQARFSDRVQANLDERGVAQVVLDRPDKLNALDAAMFDGLLEAGDWLRQARGLRAVVLRGAGRAFCAGLDMASFAGMAKGGNAEVSDLLARTYGVANRAQQVAWQWHTLPVPVIAALEGAAFGGGLQVALGADLRYVAADARLSIMEIRWGLVPDMAGMALMRGLVRADVMRELVYTGRIVDAEEACRLGLATRMCAQPVADALALAADIAGRSPDAIRAAKRLLGQAADADAATLLAAESAEQQALIGSPNQREAVRAGLEKRAPTFVD